MVAYSSMLARDSAAQLGSAVALTARSAEAHAAFTKQAGAFLAGGAVGGTLTANVRLNELALKCGCDSSSTQVLGRWVPLRVACRTCGRAPSLAAGSSPQASAVVS